VPLSTTIGRPNFPRTSLDDARVGVRVCARCFPVCRHPHSRRLLSRRSKFKADAIRMVAPVGERRVASDPGGPHELWSGALPLSRLGEISTAFAKVVVVCTEQLAMIHWSANHTTMGTSFCLKAHEKHRRDRFVCFSAAPLSCTG
jgi:hypothetical protein